MEMVEILSKLESQGFRFGPRRQNNIDRFDYYPPTALTSEQSGLMIQLKRDEAAVCAFLVSRAKFYLQKMRQIAMSTRIK